MSNFEIIYFKASSFKASEILEIYWISFHFDIQGCSLCLLGKMKSAGLTRQRLCLAMTVLC